MFIKISIHYRENIFGESYVFLFSSSVEAFMCNYQIIMNKCECLKVFVSKTYNFFSLTFSVYYFLLIFANIVVGVCF